MTENQSDPDEKIDVSIVLPIHNEEGHIELELDRIRAAMDASRFSYEIIAVDDGSTDGSKERLRATPGINLIDLPVNRGCGFARGTGSRAARGEVVVWTDVDMTYPNDRIPELVEALDDYHEQVVGARGKEAGTHAWARKPAKRFIRWLASYLVHASIPDLNSGYRAFRRETLRRYLHLLPNGFSCVTTITLAFLSRGHSIKYLPISYAPRAGHSKFHWWLDTQRYILVVIRMIMTFNPLRVFVPLGGFLLLVAFVKILVDIIRRDFYITSNAIILTIVSLQLIALGLLADLVVRLVGDRGEGR